MTTTQRGQGLRLRVTALALALAVVLLPMAPSAEAQKEPDPPEKQLEASSKEDAVLGDDGGLIIEDGIDVVVECWINGPSNIDVNQSAGFSLGGEGCGPWADFSWWGGGSPGGANGTGSFTTTWDSPGTKTVSAGRYGLGLSKQVTVNAPDNGGHCEISGPNSVSTGQEATYRLSGEGCGPWANYSWSGGSDDTVHLDDGIRTRWSSPGNPTIRATGNGRTLERPVTVTASPVQASVIASQPAPFEPGWRVTFHNDNDNGVHAHRWDINGHVSHGSSAEYTIPTDTHVESVVVRLTVTDAHGGTDTDTDTFAVSSQPVQAEILSDPARDVFQAGDVVNFYNQHHSAYIDTYEWKINGAVVGTDPNLHYEVRGDEGELDVELTVTGYRSAANAKAAGSDVDWDRKIYIVDGEPLEPGIAISGSNIFLDELGVFSVEHLGSVRDGGTYQWTINEIDFPQQTKTIEVPLPEVGYFMIEVVYFHDSCNPGYRCTTSEEFVVGPEICIAPFDGEVPTYGTSFRLTNACLDDGGDWDDISWRWLVDGAHRGTNPEALTIDLDRLDNHSVVLQAVHPEPNVVFQGETFTFAVEGLDPATADLRAYRCSIGPGANTAVQDQLDQLNAWLLQNNATPVTNFLPSVAMSMEMAIPYSLGVWREGYIPSTTAEGSERILPPALGAHGSVAVDVELIEEAWLYKGFLDPATGEPRMTSQWSGWLEFETTVDIYSSIALEVPDLAGPLEIDFVAEIGFDYVLRIFYRTGRQICETGDWNETAGVGIGRILPDDIGILPIDDILPIDPGDIAPIDAGALERGGRKVSGR